MYFPYLRGRQFELIALREYALEHGDKNRLIPIVEPVKSTFNSLKLALPKLVQGSVKFALVLNPQVGDPNLKKIDIYESLSQELNERSNWIPAFILNNDFSVISESIRKHKFEHVMIICSDIIDTSATSFEEFISSTDIEYIVSKENRSLRRKFSSQKKLVRIDDSFNAQKRNVDYLTIPEEKFTEEHLWYNGEGYYGFSDYTVLDSEFIEGGTMPRAVAIHMSYKKDNNEVWIKHFISDTNGDISNVQGKFIEAGRKAVLFLDEKNIHTYASEELRKYVNSITYPGLGMVKKISIKNHLELINGLLP